MFSSIPLKTNQPLSQFSTFGIGGPARFFCEVHTVKQMQTLLKECYDNRLPFLVIGKGSNSLFDDRGFDGLVILNKISFCQWDGSQVEVGAGYSFSLLGAKTARQGWTGLEFASGIPGSVGGAIFMNAGANRAETADHLLEVSFVHEKGELEIFARNQIEFSYRTSSFQYKKGAIVSAKFLLHSSGCARDTQRRLIQYRMETQPYRDLSAGCVFRNPPEQSAGALIERCGLKGMKIGGAEVSLIHANFIVNKGGATAKEIMLLASQVQNIVKEKQGIVLEMELRCLPFSFQAQEKNVSG